LLTSKKGLKGPIELKLDSKTVMLIAPFILICEITSDPNEAPKKLYQLEKDLVYLLEIRKVKEKNKNYHMYPMIITDGGFREENAITAETASINKANLSLLEIVDSSQFKNTLVFQNTYNITFVKHNDIYSLDKAIHCKIAAIQDSINKIDEKLENRIAGVENRIVGVENRIAGVENRIAGVENRIAGVEKSIETVIHNQIALSDLFKNEMENLRKEMAKFFKEDTKVTKSA